jgi:hypothetical protein
MTEMKQKIQIQWLIPPSYGIWRHFTADTYLEDVLKIDNWKSTELAIKLKKSHPDINRGKNLQNYSLFVSWTSSPLLQTSFIISLNILRTFLGI